MLFNVNYLDIVVHCTYTLKIIFKYNLTSIHMLNAKSHYKIGKEVKDYRLKENITGGFYRFNLKTVQNNSIDEIDNNLYPEGICLNTNNKYTVYGKGNLKPYHVTHIKTELNYHTNPPKYVKENENYKIQHCNVWDVLQELNDSGTVQLNLN